MFVVDVFSIVEGLDIDVVESEIGHVTRRKRSAAKTNDVCRMI